MIRGTSVAPSIAMQIGGEAVKIRKCGRSLEGLRIAAIIVVAVFFPSISKAQAFHFGVPLDTTVVNNCVGESVLVQGNIDVTIEQSIDDAGGTHFHLHIVSKGKGIGLITLTNYSFSAEFEDSLDVPGPPLTISHEIVLNHQLIADGNWPNSYLKVRLHLTLNAAGVPTAQIASVDIHCQ